MAEPMVVNTVSNNTESAEKSTFAEASVISLSFLQPNCDTSVPMINTMKSSFFKPFKFSNNNGKVGGIIVDAKSKEDY